MRGLLGAALSASAFIVGSLFAATAAAQLEPSMGIPAELHAKFSRGFDALRPTRLMNSQRNLLLKKQAPDSLRVLVVGVDFSDSLMVGRSNAMAEFGGWPDQSRGPHIIPGTNVPTFSAHDAVYFDIQMRKVADYFESVSQGAFRLSWDVHPEIVNVARFARDPLASMGYFGDDDSSSVRLSKLSQAVIDSVDGSVDFSPYDTLVLIHAGAGQETDILGDSPDQIFSDYLDSRDFQEAFEAGLLGEARLRSDESDIGHVLILPESESQDPYPEAGFFGFFGTLGVYCFEFGLRLGMLSLSDFTPSGAPDSQGIGNFGLMGYGLFTGLGIVPAAPCAFNRWLAGWVDRVDVVDDADLRIASMGPQGEAVGDSLLVRVPIDDREYFLLEYRLQDPDGDLFFSFDDLNGNHVPDFFDFDSAFGDGTPTSPYDPAVDTWESTLGAEWDYFMSENPLRGADRCSRGGGSGLYIWHIDERVIMNAVLTDQNIINADPRHKGVDVEEADGVQDLDSPRPSGYFLGWDGDVWRGEGNDEFGPATIPSSESADGLRTGIRIYGIQTVVVDSFVTGGVCDAFVYRPALRLSVEFAADAALPARRSARARMSTDPGRGDLRLADLGTTPLDPTPDGTLEIVQAGDGGRVYAFNSDLSEWADGDADPLTVGVLAEASGPGGNLPAFHPPPALLDLDGDGVLEIFLSAPEGIYAFRADGGELSDADLDPTTFGLVYTDGAASIVGPPIVTGDGRIVVLTDDGGNVGPLTLSNFDGQSFEANRYAIPLGAVSSDGAALVQIEGGDALAFAWADDSGRGVAYMSVGPQQHSAYRTTSSTQLMPFAQTLRPEGVDLLIVDRSGAVVRDPLPAALEAPPLELPAALNPRRSPAFDGSLSAVVGGLQRAGGTPVLAYVAGRRLLALDRNLELLSGFPHLPFFHGASQYGAPLQAAPLLVDLDGDGRVEMLWHGPSGAVHAVDLDGDAVVGWPVQAAAEAAGSPAIGDIDGDGLLELVVCGRFQAIEDIDSPSSTVSGPWVGELQLFELDAVATNFAPWAQGRGGIENRASQSLDGGRNGIARSGSVLEPGSLFIHPHPVRGSSLRVRVLLRRSARVRATLYNLEGEAVAESPDVGLTGGGAFEEQLDVGHLSSGMYVCRVSAGGEHLALPFTVVR